MVGVDVGDYRHHRLENKGTRRRTRQPYRPRDTSPAAEACIGAGAVEPRRRSRRSGRTRAARQFAHQAGGGGLAVGAGDRDAALQAHELAQHLGARTTGMRARARPRTSRLVSVTAEEITTTSAPFTSAASWPTNATLDAEPAQAL